MHREGHLGVGLFVYAPFGALVAAVADPVAALSLGVAVGGLSMLPDIDMRIPFIAHRGVTHTLRFLYLVTGVAFLAGVLLGGLGSGPSRGLFAGVLAGLIVGLAVGSHLLADMLTPAGVDLYGTGDRISVGLSRAANPITNYVLLGIGIGSLGLALLIGTTLGSLVGG